MQFFDWLQHSSIPMWIKESESVWPYDIFCISFPAVGMAILVGLSVAVSLRILGMAPTLPLGPMEGLFPIMFAGFWLNVLSGIGLFSAYPIKAVENPVFFVKMTGVVLAVLCLRRLKKVVFGNPANLGTNPVGKDGRMVAIAMLGIWFGTITAGRLLAYHKIAGVEVETTIAVLIVSAVLLVGGYAGGRIWGSSKPSHGNL